jgi:hypothetical protein
MLGLFAMNLRQLMIGITFLAIFAMALRISADTDTWWQLRTGESILEEGSIPKTDSFSFTRAGEEWRYPSAAWLSEIQLYSIYNTFGPGGLNIWTAALVTLAFAFIYMTLSGGLFLRAFTLILAAAAAAVYWAARPYMLSFVLAAVFLWILEDYRWGRRNRLVWLPLLMILWANSHPGFAVGFLLLFIYIVDQGLRWLSECWHHGRGLPIGRKELRAAWRGWMKPLALSTMGMLAAVAINPSVAALLRYPFDTVSIGVLRNFIQEWQSPDFHLLSVQPFAWLLLITLAVLAISRKRIAASDLMLVGVFAYLAFLAARNIALFALVAPIVLTRHAAPLVEEGRKKFVLLKMGKSKPFKWKRLANLGIFLVLALGVIAKATLVLPADANQGTFDRGLPLGAVTYLERERPVGNLFNSYNWGGYLVWALRDYPVFVDGRTDLYGDQFLTEWLSIVNADEGWQAKLERWDVRLVLLEPSWALTKVLPTEGWHLLYEDSISVLYGR